MDTPNRTADAGLPRSVQTYIEAERGPGRRLSAEAEARLERDSLIDLARKSITGAAMYPLLTASTVIATGLHERTKAVAPLLVLLLASMAVYRLSVSRRILRGRVRPGDRRRVQWNMYAMGAVFALFCALAIVHDGTTESGFFAIVLLVGFLLGGALILAQEGRAAWLFALGVMAPPLLAVLVVRPPHWLAIGICFALCLAFIVRISGILHREYWMAKIRRAVLSEQERELRLAHAAAEQALAVREEFLRNVSHEMRTPMNGVVGMLELASETTNLDEIQELIAYAQQSAQSMVALVDNVLTFANEVEQSPTHREIFDPRHLGRSVLDTFGRRASEIGLELIFQAGEGLPSRIACDRIRLRQLLDALVSNAVKFTSEGRVILRLDARNEAGRWRLIGTVEDTGIGIAPDARALIFEPFRQLDTGVARAYDGLGIGLPVARRLAEQLDGELDLQDKPGRGSCFRFEIAIEAAGVPSLVSSGV